MTDSTTTTPSRTAGIVFVSILGALLVAAVLATAWIGIRAALAYGHLRDAQAAAAAVRAELANPSKAAGAIDGIAADTRAARELTSDPVWRVAELLPWVGPQLTAVSTVAASLDDVAGTALTPLATVAASFELDDLRPQDGRIDLAGFVSIRDAATTGADAVSRAAASVDAIDRAPLLSPLRTAIADVAGILAETRGATDALARATALIPAMLGADGPRDYLVLFQNNAEWRSLGGIPGAMAVIHTDGGAISLGAQESSTGFPRYEASVLPLGAEVDAIYGERPGQWIQNVTQLPDFAGAGALAREMWQRERGQTVDGVIALDPVTLSYLLTATGPVTLPTGDVLTADNAVPLLLNEAYLRYARPADQDVFFAAAAASVFAALSQGSTDPVALTAALARAGDEHRLLLWSAHEDDQRVLAGTTIAGGLPPTNADASTFGVYLNDGTGSKMDYYLTAATTVAWDACTLSASGTTADGTATLTMTLTNNAPADVSSLPDYITGGGWFGVPAGIARTIAYLYLPVGAELLDAKRTGDGGFGGGFHENRHVLTASIDLAPGETSTTTLAVRLPAGGSPRLVAESTPTLSGNVTVVDVCGGPVR